ncbi:glycine/betaine ABC transporter substrate-binding protein [Streptomyces kronopolitis]|uniref:Glycine/betaine ABC transporter substrate-binding protein n=1 Tax=Streptomyces kronopolitis TaxID=1612435 RepID=A0ABQ2J225_9ACTN|nr:ABC transporter substrate-binding protein [Streptomyces kronopolitis]GGN38143.1 glycine/betaine ABC transporter substrate-binding protein [Streptomyces kronopolitis]
MRAAGPVLVLLAVVGLGACAGGPSLETRSAITSSPGDSHELAIGSAGFTESELLAQMYAALLDHAGYRTHVVTVGNRELYEPALEAGQIDVVPEYAATFADWLNTKNKGSKAAPVASPDLGVTMAALRRLAAPRGLTVLPAGRAVDQNAFAVSAAYARKHHLKTLSDLGRSKLPVRLAAGDECVQRPFCAPGLRKKYGIHITAIDPKGVGTTPAKRAVQNGQDQMMLTTSTDATLDKFGLVLLTDDKKLQNADYVLPVVNRSRAGSARVAAALNRLGKVLTTADLAYLNEQVDSWRRLPEDVARAFLRSKGLLPKG